MTLGVRPMARELECSPGLVSRYKDAGMPMTSAAEARQWMRDNVRQRLGSPAARRRDDLEQPADYQRARAEREAAEAAIAQLKLAEMQGELVRADAVKAALAKRVAATREALLQLPARVVPLLVADPSAAAMDQALRAEITAALAALTEEAQ